MTKCIGFIVPDMDTQIKMSKLGFCLDTPMKSFKVNPTDKEYNTCFGGVHISILRRRKYTRQCMNILRNIATDLKDWKIPDNVYLQTGVYQVFHVHAF